INLLRTRRCRRSVPASGPHPIGLRSAPAPPRRLRRHAPGGRVRARFAPTRRAMNYRAPVADIAFALKHAAGFAPALADGLYGDLSEDVVDAVLAEAGRFATEVLGPLNTVGDRVGAAFKDGAVVTPPGWKEAYQAWAAGGWNALAAPEAW